MNAKPLVEYWLDHAQLFRAVVPLDRKTDKLLRLDLSASNKELTESIYSDTLKFSAYIDNLRKKSKARYLVGGYGELRVVYSYSDLFGNGSDEPRRLHLGLDIWGPAGTHVLAVAAGRVHSFAWNHGKGNYGGTVILEHDSAGIRWHTLYGHLNMSAALEKKKGTRLKAGDPIGVLGIPAENGDWPPHLHFQVILDMQGMEGDYPGVCRHSEMDQYLANCPDPEGLLQWSQNIMH